MFHFITIITIQLFIRMIVYYHSIFKLNDKGCYFFYFVIVTFGIPSILPPNKNTMVWLGFYEKNQSPLSDLNR